MSTRIPFLDELKADLLAHAPGDVVFAPPASPGPRRRLGPVVAVAAFTAVVALGGLVAWLTSGRTGEVAGPGLIEWHLRAMFDAPDDPTGFIATVEGLEGVVESQYFSDASVPFPPQPLPGRAEVTVTTPEGSEASIVTIRTATLLVRLDDSARAEETAAAIREIEGVWRVIYSDAVAASQAESYFAWAAEGATVLRQRPLVLQPTLGPEPRFDVSDLGREIVLVPGEPGDAADDVLYGGLLRGEHPEDGFVVPGLPVRDQSRPILHIGSDARGIYRLLVFPTLGDGFCETVTSDGGSGSGGCGLFAHFGYGFASWGSDGMSVWVPMTTSVVVLSVVGDEPMWQRPTAGWARFNVASDGWGGPSATLEAYDADGALIGRWES